MSNILWIQSNKKLALTTIAIDTITPEEYAKELQERKDVPSDWVIAGYNVEWPSDGHPHEAYRWVNNQIVVDETALAELNNQPAQPTTEELLLQLKAIVDAQQQEIELLKAKQ